MMHHFYCRLFVLFCLFLLIGIGATGCSTNALPVQSVSGTVTYKGQPLEGATVVFVSANNSFGHSASDVTAADGSYSIRTHGANKNGALMGDYNVAISKTILVDINGKEYVDENQPVRGRPNVKHLIPEKYGDSDKPLLSATVKKGSNVFNFNIED